MAGQLSANQQPCGLLQRLVCQPQALYASSSALGVCTAEAAPTQGHQLPRPGTADRGSALVHRPPSAGGQGVPAPSATAPRCKAPPWRAPPSPDTVRSSTSRGLRYLTHPASSGRAGVSHVRGQLSGQAIQAAAPAGAAAPGGPAPQARNGVSRIIQQQRHVVQQAGVLSQKAGKAAQQSKRSVGCQSVDAPLARLGPAFSLDAVGPVVVTANAAATASRASSAAADCQAQTDQAVAVQAVMVTATAAAAAAAAAAPEHRSQPVSEAAHGADDVEVPPDHQASSAGPGAVTQHQDGLAATGVQQVPDVEQQQQRQQLASKPHALARADGQMRQKPTGSSSSLAQSRPAAKSGARGSAQALPAADVAAKTGPTVQHSSSRVHARSSTSSSSHSSSTPHRHRVPAAAARHVSGSEAAGTRKPRPQPTEHDMGAGDQPAEGLRDMPTADVPVLANSSGDGSSIRSISQRRLPALSSRPSTAGIPGGAAGAGASATATGAAAHSTDRLRALLETPPVRCSSSSGVGGSRQQMPTGRLQPLQCAGHPAAPAARPSTAPPKPVDGIDAAYRESSGSRMQGHDEPCDPNEGAGGDAVSPQRADRARPTDPQKEACRDVQQHMPATAADTAEAVECAVPAAMAEQLAAAAQAAQEELHAAFLQARSRHSAAASRWKGQQQQQQQQQQQEQEQEREEGTALHEPAGATLQPWVADEGTDMAENRQLATKRAVAAQQLRDTAATLLAAVAQQSEERTQTTWQQQPVAAEVPEHGLDSLEAGSPCVSPAPGAGTQPMAPAAAPGSSKPDGSTGSGAGVRQTGGSRRGAQPLMQAAAPVPRGGSCSPSKRNSSSSSSREAVGAGRAAPKPGTIGARQGPAQRTSGRAAATATAAIEADASPAAAMAEPSGSLAQRIQRLQQRMAEAMQQAQEAVAEMDGALLLTALQAPAAAGGMQQDAGQSASQPDSEVTPAAYSAGALPEPEGVGAAAEGSYTPTAARGAAGRMSGHHSSIADSRPLSYAHNPWLAAVAAGRAAREGRMGVGGTAADRWQDDGESSDSEDELLVSLGGMFCSRLPPDPYAPAVMAQRGEEGPTQGTRALSADSLPGFHSSLPPDPYA